MLQIVYHVQWECIVSHTSCNPDMLFCTSRCKTSKDCLFVLQLLVYQVALNKKRSKLCKRSKFPCLDVPWMNPNLCSQIFSYQYFKNLVLRLFPTSSSVTQIFQSLNKLVFLYARKAESVFGYWHVNFFPHEVEKNLVDGKGGNVFFEQIKFRLHRLFPFSEQLDDSFTLLFRM